MTNLAFLCVLSGLCGSNYFLLTLRLIAVMHRDGPVFALLAGCATFFGGGSEMRDQIRGLLDQFKIICGNEMPDEVWEACLILSNLPDQDAVQQLHLEIMRHLETGEVPEMLRYLNPLVRD